MKASKVLRSVASWRWALGLVLCVAGAGACVWQIAEACSSNKILTVQVQGTGTVNVNPPNQNVTTSQSISCAANSSVTLTATAGTGYRFDHWENAYTGSANPLSVTMDVDKIVVAVFAPEIKFQSAGSSVAESAGTATVTVTRTAVPLISTVSYAISGTATGGGVDYTLASGQLTFASSETTKTISIPIVNDVIDEPNETVIVTLSSPTQATLVTPTTHTLTITDNDNPPTMQLASVASSLNEATGTAAIPVTLSVASGYSVTVAYTVTGTATGGGVDYTLASGTLSIPAGQTTGNLTANIVNDTLDEPDETVVVTLSSPTQATLGTSTTHTLTITDNDNPPTMQLASAASPVNEATPTATIPITLSAASGYAATVAYSVSGTSTGGGVDYTLASGTFTIPAGQTTGNLAVSIVNDTLDEPDETVIVTLTSPTQAILGTPSAHTLTIADNDNPPMVQCASATSSVNEATATATISASLSAASSYAVTVSYSVSGTATGGGVDYTLANGQLTFAANETTKSISIPIVNDVLDEDDETIIITLSNPTSATLGNPSTCESSIVDDDASPSVSFASPTHQSLEDELVVPVSVTLSTPSGREVRVPYTIAGTATQGADYDVPQADIVFAPGVTASTVPVSIHDDEQLEAEETIVLALAASSGATLGSCSTSTLTIIDSYNLNLSIFGEGQVERAPDLVAYNPGTLVTLHAVPSHGWTFKNWGPPLESTTNPIQLEMDSAKVVVAIFERASFEITTTCQGQGLISRTSPGPSYEFESLVTLTAEPATGWVFQGWEGDLSNSNTALNNPLAVTVNSNLSLTAKFAEKPQLNLSVTGSGTVSASPQPDADGRYPLGTRVTLTALSGVFSRFMGWSEGAVARQSEPYTAEVTMDANRNVGALFSAANELQVEVATGTFSKTGLDAADFVQTSPSERPTAVPKQLGRIRSYFPSGTEVGLDAAGHPESEIYFDAWRTPTGEFISRDLHHSIVLDDDAVIRAEYVQPQVVLGVSTFGEGDISFVDEPDAKYQKGIIRPFVTTNQPVTIRPVPESNWVLDHWLGASAQCQQVAGEPQSIVVPNAGSTNIAMVFVPKSDSVSHPADVNHDGKIDAGDVQTVVNAILGIPSAGNPDINLDGAVNASDMQIVINAVLGFYAPQPHDLDSWIVGIGAVQFELLAPQSPPEQQEADHPSGKRVTLDHRLYKYRNYTRLRMKAFPADGWYFDGWIGHLSGNSSVQYLVMDREITMGAVFKRDAAKSNLDSDGDGLTDADEAQLGTNPNSSDSDGDTLPDGWEHTYGLNPISASGEDGASGDPDGDFVNNQREFGYCTSPREKGIPLHVYTYVQGEGTVTLDPQKEVYSLLDQVTATAMPGTGYVFSHWEGALTGTDPAPPTHIVVGGHMAVRAVFLKQITPYIEVTGNGGVTMDNPSGVYIEGDTATFTATPDEGWRFDHWESGLAGTEPVQSTRLAASLSLEAVFVPSHFTLLLEVTPSAPGVLVRRSDGTVFGPFADGTEMTLPAGETVTLLPAEQEGWRFSHWSSDIPQEEPDFTFLVDRDCRVSAYFEALSTVTLNRKSPQTFDGISLSMSQMNNRTHLRTMIPVTDIERTSPTSLKITVAKGSPLNISILSKGLSGPTQWHWVNNLEYPAYDSFGNLRYMPDWVERYGNNVSVDPANENGSYETFDWQWTNPEDFSCYFDDRFSWTIYFCIPITPKGGAIQFGQEIGVCALDYDPPALLYPLFVNIPTKPDSVQTMYVQDVLIRGDLSGNPYGNFNPAMKRQLVSFGAYSMAPGAEWEGWYAADSQGGPWTKISDDREFKNYISRLDPTYALTYRYFKPQWKAQRKLEVDVFDDHRTFSTSQVAKLLYVTDPRTNTQLVADPDSPKITFTPNYGDSVRVLLSNYYLNRLFPNYEFDHWEITPEGIGVATDIETPNQSLHQYDIASLEQDAKVTAVLRFKDVKVKRVEVTAATSENIFDGCVVDGNLQQSPEMYGGSVCYFDGGKEEWGHPDATPLTIYTETHSPANSSRQPYPRAFVVYFKDVRQAVPNDNLPKPFWINFEAKLDPDTLTGATQDITDNFAPHWAFEADSVQSGTLQAVTGEPLSGKLMFDASHPPVPGLYKIRFELRRKLPDGEETSAPLDRTCVMYVLLPQAGPDITDWLINEAHMIADPGGAADAWNARTLSQIEDSVIRIDSGDYYFTPQEWKRDCLTAMGSFDFDYLGNVCDYSRGIYPTPRYNFCDAERKQDDTRADDKPYNDPGYATLQGFVIIRAKVTDILAMVISLSLGKPELEFRDDVKRYAQFHGDSEDATASAAYDIGVLLYQAVINHQDDTFIRTWYLTPNNVRELQVGVALNDTRLWPRPDGSTEPNRNTWNINPNALGSGRYGFTRPKIFLSEQEVMTRTQRMVEDIAEKVMQQLFQ